MGQLFQKLKWMRECPSRHRSSILTTSIYRCSANGGQQAKEKEEDKEAGTPEVKIESTETLYNKLNCFVIL